MNFFCMICFCLLVFFGHPAEAAPVAMSATSHGFRAATMGGIWLLCSVALISIRLGTLPGVHLEDSESAFPLDV
jgi:ABC-type phosphate transport system permease subunit